MDKSELLKLSLNCKKFLVGRGVKNTMPQKVLGDLSSSIDDELFMDIYGEGVVIESFEKEVATLLGKEAAVFMPSGTMAQQIALRIWADRSGFKNIAFHPKSHLEIHEQKGYQYLHGLNGILVGSPEGMITLDDLKKINQPLSSILLELPQREIGGQLSSWEDLIEITGWARRKEIRLHMDGARLWECKPFYQRDYAEIARLFDSVYVSMYKGLGAIAGSVLAGSANFIAESRIWLRRHGGNLISMYPFILSAKMGLDAFLPRMQQYYDKACEVANVFSGFPGIKVLPNPPQTNMMHLFIQADQEKLENAVYEIARDQQVMLFRRFSPSQVPGFVKTEVTIQDGAFEIGTEELETLLQELLTKAEAL